jgi:malto-oligosyltrehalose trehalohydrolase
MPFGTKFNRETGQVQFRLWAPNATDVALALNTDCQESSVAMRKEERGWFFIETDASAGQTYQFIVDGALAVPDPASRFQPADVHGPSEIVDPTAFAWKDQTWQGRAWEEAVLYELNVGTFTKEGTFQAVEKKLPELANLGVTAIELMPLADFPGRWGWGYDGVLPYAPDSSYGRPEDLKSLVQAAHNLGLMVFLDVVYNHFGPEGNYLHVYAKRFFTEKHHTPWGAAMNVDDTDSDIVRKFFIENALYWLTEYHFDGLRLDAVHAIKDESSRHFLVELADSVATRIGGERLVHLVVENDQNTADFLRKCGKQQKQYYTAQWNDDIHHAFHVLATGESTGYYAGFTKEGSELAPIVHLGRCLTQGFTYQGQESKHHGHFRGQPSAHLPPTAFVSFIQNHDQAGNRAFGDRIASLIGAKVLRALSAIYLLSPSIPMIFMGEEWGSQTPFYYFCDLGPELGPLVTEGRRKEFARFPEFSSPETRERIPDPCKEETFLKSKLDWNERKQPQAQELHQHYQSLLAIRAREIVPLLEGWEGTAKFSSSTDHSHLLHAQWSCSDGKDLHLLANLGEETLQTTGGIGRTTAKEISRLLSSARPIYASKETSLRDLKHGEMKSWTVIWLRA